LTSSATGRRLTWLGRPGWISVARLSLDQLVSMTWQGSRHAPTQPASRSHKTRGRLCGRPAPRTARQRGPNTQHHTHVQHAGTARTSLLRIVSAMAASGGSSSEAMATASSNTPPAQHSMQHTSCRLLPPTEVEMVLVLVVLLIKRNAVAVVLWW